MLDMALPVSKMAGLSSAADRPSRLERIFVENYRLVWRIVRRIGVPEAHADDAAQQVFLIAAERLDEIKPASERAFVFGAALRVARALGRKLAREPLTDRSDEGPSPLPRPDELTNQKRALEALDAILRSMPLELRTVFVLFELDGISMRQIAELAQIPPGTVASRLRRARELFREAVRNAYRDPTSNQATSGRGLP